MIHNVQMHRPSIAPVLILSTRMGMQSMLYILAVLISVSPLTLGQMVITEWMYSGTDGGFIEFTNIGSEAVDLSGWNFCDNSPGPAVDLSDFGIVEPGNSVILTEASAESFAAAWASRKNSPSNYSCSVSRGFFISRCSSSGIGASKHICRPSTGCLNEIDLA